VTGVVKRVVVAGGGSAGWLTAGVIAAEHRAGSRSGIEVSLIESPDVATIGVGEGTWPSMRDTLRRMGVSETDFIRECDASFKQGSKFVNWVTGAEDDCYYHPFVVPQGYGETNLVWAWQAGHADVPFADLVCFQPHLCERGRAPKQIGTPEYAAVANYAYHLDAGKFGRLLQRHCTKKLGVTHIRDHIRAVNTADNGDIATLKTDAHGSIAGDLFIDCTGFASLLLGGQYAVPFASRKETLFNDTALALRVPYADETSAIASHTIATAQSAGWIWDIGLSSRRGIGYVYSSAHTSDEEAERALRRYVEGSTSSSADGLEFSPRRISFTPGHREKFWHRNCVAVGMAAGFIEPLEASALVLVELSAAMISDELPTSREAMDVAARRFNDRFRYRWDRIVDFLKLHYILTRRTDSDYWIDHCREHGVPERLRDSLVLWRHRPPSRNDLFQIEEIFPAASYQYVLYGMGFKPSTRATAGRSDDSERADMHFRECANMTARLLAGLPSNRELLQLVREHGIPAI
jgi:2-polyprenyl-6-methoxyphenol hydroxylase-like FAD-dependent oxidoreductase